jgi:hypothetical protein
LAVLPFGVAADHKREIGASKRPDRLGHDQNLRACDIAFDGRGAIEQSTA